MASASEQELFGLRDKGDGDRAAAGWEASQKHRTLHRDLLYSFVPNTKVPKEKEPYNSWDQAGLSGSP